MNKAKIVIISTAATGLSLGFSLQPHPVPFWETNIVIAAEETSLNVQTDEDSSAAKSAKMGRDEVTQTGRANQGTPPENDTKKVDQSGY
jgi:hypothetical protein